VILWLDAQLSPALANWITEQFTQIQAVPVRELGLRNADDREIFVQARSAGAVVMTKDRDFLHLLFEQGPPPQVIRLRVGNKQFQPGPGSGAVPHSCPGVHVATLSGMFGLSGFTSTL
jgi:predicted nuclease of predicted toxin-antitoxin system